VKWNWEEKQQRVFEELKKKVYNRASPSNITNSRP